MTSHEMITKTINYFCCHSDEGHDGSWSHEEGGWACWLFAFGSWANHSSSRDGPEEEIFITDCYSQILTDNWNQIQCELRWLQEGTWKKEGMTTNASHEVKSKCASGLEDKRERTLNDWLTEWTTTPQDEIHGAWNWIKYDVRAGEEKNIQRSWCWRWRGWRMKRETLMMNIVIASLSLFSSLQSLFSVETTKMMFLIMLLLRRLSVAVWQNFDSRAQREVTF